MDLKKTSLVLAAVIAFVVIIFSSRMFKVIEAGERGVVFKVFRGGLDTEHILKPGLNLIAPYNTLYVYDVRRQTREETMNVLDKSGLSINMDVTILYFPTPERIGFLHESVGINYEGIVVVPAFRSAVRQVAGRYTAEEIYSTKRSEVENAIYEETKAVLKKNNIEMSQLLIRSINLPEQIKMAIENKLKQEQEALAYKFKLDKEKSEAERKNIEAEGTANFNRIINSSLTASILKQRGIEATLQLAQSPNSKVVVVGSGKDGLPLILGN